MNRIFAAAPSPRYRPSAWPARPTPGKDLDAIKARPADLRSQHPAMAGFRSADNQGKWTGLDVDVCRAAAAALVGDFREGEVRATHSPAALYGRCSRAKSTSCRVTRPGR